MNEETTKPPKALKYFVTELIPLLRKKARLEQLENNAQKFWVFSLIFLFVKQYCVDKYFPFPFPFEYLNLAMLNGAVVMLLYTWGMLFYINRKIKSCQKIVDELRDSENTDPM